MKLISISSLVVGGCSSSRYDRRKSITALARVASRND